MHTKAFTHRPSKLPKNLASLHLKVYHCHLKVYDIFQNISERFHKFFKKNYKTKGKREKLNTDANDLVHIKNLKFYV